LRRKVLGYTQTLELLKQGKFIEWIGVPLYIHVIEHATVKEDILRRLKTEKLITLTSDKHWILKV
jgi:hypothetical protein